MFLLILTLTLCLTKAFVFENAEEPLPPTKSAIEPIYNIHEWVTKLQLERCAFVAIGLKYYALFVEDETVGACGRLEHREYFLGVCHQSTLEEWTFCAPTLAKRRKHKCRFKLRTNRYEARVHRRFCDIRMMVNNKDCQCEATILGDEMVKVKGFPTCYMPPISNSLCKYNVCGLFQCRTAAIENRIYSVECSSKCRGGNPFCEYPMDETSTVPVSRSFWSKWETDISSESQRMTRKKHFTATCINKYTGKGDVDCLGPGTGCCSGINQNCSCDTFEENGVLKLEKTIYETYKEPKHKKHRRKFYRHVRAPDDEDIEDDDDDEDADLDDDIALEENTDAEMPITTTEELERDEAAKELQIAAMKEVNQKSNATAELKNGASMQSDGGILFIITSLCLSVKAVYNFYL